MENQATIEDGPDKFKLFAKFGLRESIRFQVNINGKSDFIDVTINNLGFEDGSGESFLLEGHSEDGRIFKKGYYHTKKKTGYLKLR